MAKIQKTKWTNAQIKRHITILEIVEQNKKNNKQENFTGITKEEIEKKFKRVNSPMIVSQGYPRLHRKIMEGVVNLYFNLISSRQ